MSAASASSTCVTPSSRRRSASDAAAPPVVGRPYAVESHQWVARWWDQRRKARHELGRRHDAGLLAILDAVTDPAVVEHREPIEREGRARAVAEQSFTRGGQPARHADASMEIEVQVLCTEASNGLGVRTSACLVCWLFSCVSHVALDPCSRARSHRHRRRAWERANRRAGLVGDRAPLDRHASGRGSDRADCSPTQARASDDIGGELR